MKKISTTALAKKREMETKELFNVLTKNKWIYKKENKWCLSNEGRMAGGDTKYNPKFGEYIVWPVNLDLEQKTDYKETLSVTKIGQEYKCSGQKINLLLSELGWIEKERDGWIYTDSGELNGAIQMEARNGKPYVVWNKEILKNEHFNRVINEVSVDEKYSKDYEKQVNESDDFRKKFPRNYRAPDGHYVRSRGEVMLDAFLYNNGIVHAYERKLNIEENMYCDFYIPSKKIYIEYWGLDEDKKYLDRKKKKLEIYAKYKLKLVEVSNSDLENLDEKLASKLRKHGLNVDY